MKKNHRFIAVLMLFFIFSLSTIFAQERPKFLTVTTIHGNINKKDFSMDDWKAMEKEYFDKVTNKNEFVKTALVLVHYFTADNSEIKLVHGYASWEDIERAANRADELEKEGWPDENARKAFFKNRASYYTGMHSDEIYSTLAGAKMMTEKPTEPMVYYVRKSHTAWPENGSEESISAMAKEYFDNVINKNKYIKGYYPSRHAWGSDGRDLIEGFVVQSLCDVENALKENQKLTEAHWPDESKRKAFFKEMNSYMTGWHADYIFRSVPELTK